MKSFIKIFGSGLIGLTVLILIIFVVDFFILPAKTIKAVLPQFLKFTGLEYIITVVIIIALGLIISNLAHKIQIPIIGELLSSLHHISKSQPVLITSLYGHGKMLGFLTNTEIKDPETGKKLIGVFIPTSPNISTGFFILVPENEIKQLPREMTTSYLKMIISGGFFQK